jgi:hypothetical protein
MDLLVEAELKRALAAPGCPLCRVGEEAVHRYLRFVLHEGVNDLATRSRLAEAWGFCRRHAWHFLRLEWATMRDGLGTANIVEALLTTLKEALHSYLSAGPGSGRKRAERLKVEQFVRALTPTSECPACRIQADHDDYSLSVLLSVSADEEWRERVERSDGLCLPHLRQALVTGEAADRIRWLVEDHRRRVQALLADLEEYIRKHDYRFGHEPYARERDAFVRATAAMAGSWFDLPRRPPGRDGSEVERVEAQGGERHG